MVREIYARYLTIIGFVIYGSALLAQDQASIDVCMTSVNTKEMCGNFIEQEGTFVDGRLQRPTYGSHLFVNYFILDTTEMNDDGSTLFTAILEVSHESDGLENRRIHFWVGQFLRFDSAIRQEAGIYVFSGLGYVEALSCVAPVEIRVDARQATVDSRTNDDVLIINGSNIEKTVRATGGC